MIYKAKAFDKRFAGKEAVVPTDLSVPYPEDIITTDFDVDRTEHQRLLDEGVIGVSVPTYKLGKHKRMKGRWQTLLGDDFSF